MSERGLLHVTVPNDATRAYCRRLARTRVVSHDSTIEMRELSGIIVVDVPATLQRAKRAAILAVFGVYLKDKEAAGAGVARLRKQRRSPA